jgi:CSLREA domain-containing protein
MYIMVILAVALSVTTIRAYAARPSPFIGNWQAIDVDGSDMNLSIAGRPNKPFQITWTDNYISFCNGGAGIVRGTGWLNEGDSNLLEADVHLECFTTGATLDFHVTFRYHPATNTLSIRYSSGQVTIWHRPGRPQPLPPTLNLRVNYGHDWVESFYEAGHMAWVTVTDGDGNVKATAEAITDSSGYFQTQWLDWLDGDGNPMESPPDIQPYDWVYGWVDNGASAQVQIGEITGEIDLVADSIVGTINAPWFIDEENSIFVDVDCHSWGAPLPEEILKYDTVQPNGEDTYSCSWLGEWDIQPGQDVGVGYSGPDGHWVANAFFEPATIIVTSIDDVIGDDGVCTLREAIIAANTNTPSGLAAGECQAGLEFATDTILLAPDAIYSLTIDSTNEDGALDGDLDIWDNSPATDLVIRVEGGGAATISQDASVDDRVLDILGATVQIEGLTLTGGSNVWTGGGVQNTGTLTATGSTISNNTVTGGGGGIWSSGTLTVDATTVSYNSAIWGGGIVNRPDAMLTVIASTIADNVAGEQGGGIVNRDGGTALVDGSTIFNNSVLNDGGGGILNEGSLTLTNSNISGNTANHDGGGIANTGTLIIDASTVSANSGQGGGGLANWPDGTATIQNGSVIGGDPSAGEGNTASDDGGGVINFGTLMVDSSTVSGNSSNYGGGLANWGGMVTLTSTTVSGNSASASAGGLFNKDGGTTTIENGSVISGNTATWDGGGINNWEGMVTLSNSTVSGNSAGQSGGGILNLVAGIVTADASTISGNTATWDGGGVNNWGTLIVTGSALLANISHGEGDAIYSAVDTVNATTVTGSCIVGNGDTAVFNSQPASQNASGNWWGADNGPTHWTNPDGTGDSVSDYVDFSGWLPEPPAFCAP